MANLVYLVSIGLFVATGGTVFNALLSGGTRFAMDMMANAFALDAMGIGAIAGAYVAVNRSRAHALFCGLAPAVAMAWLIATIFPSTPLVNAAVVITAGECLIIGGLIAVRGLTQRFLS